jgi:catechol 2,3-dioxygenase-like lactoylglutathione lyase family enzyme
MVRHFDHVTFVVADVARAAAFFALLGFVEDKRVVIAGAKFARYMGVDGIEAEHVTLVLAGAAPRTEIQLLNYRRPTTTAASDGSVNPTRPGFNHICFAVDDLAAELARLRPQGVALLNDVMEFHDRKLVFLAGPEGIVVELSQWGKTG